MFALQRVMALLMAAAMAFILLVPMGMARHDYRIVAIVLGAFVLYLAVNAWIFVRMRKRS